MNEKTAVKKLEDFKQKMENYYDQIEAKPAMYSLTPDCFESVCWNLDSLYYELHSIDHNLIWKINWPAYLQIKYPNHGVKGLAGILEEQGSEKSFDKIAELRKEFRQWRDAQVKALRG